MSKKHTVIPDGQVQPNTPLEHWAWAGEYVAEKHPDVIVNIGDFADMKSLSMYDMGKKSYEGRTYLEDIQVADHAMSLFMYPIIKEIHRLRTNKKAQWNPRLVLTLGNHENRIDRAIESDRKLEGTISVKDLEYEKWGWEVIPYLQPINIDGIMYAHFFTSGEMGRPVTSARAMSIKKHQSCTMGHTPKTEIDMSQVRADGTPIIGLFCGSFYQHNEDYLGPQGNPVHRQIWMKHEVDNGMYYIMPVSMKYLAKKYGSIDNWVPHNN